MPSWIPFHLVTAAPYDALRGVPVVPAAHLWSRAGGEVPGHDVLPAKRSCVAGRPAAGGGAGGGGGGGPGGRREGARPPGGLCRAPGRGEAAGGPPAGW